VTVIGRESAPAVVLSNALGTTSELWEAQLPALEPNFRVVLYEHAPLSSVAELADQVLALADELGLQSFSFCGLSLGGMVGLWLGAHAPNRLDRLIVAGTSARFGSAREWAKRAALVRREGMSAVAYDALEKWFTPAYLDRQPFLRMQLETSPDAYANGLDAIGGFDFRDELGSVRVSTLAIAGAEDVATTPADAAAIADRVPNGRLAVIESAAHLANVEQPAAFNQELRAHLRSNG
jgi:3-oxoadipate enol-lactonase